MRFYTGDGWTKEELMACIKTGSVQMGFPDDPNPYYTLEVGSQFDVDKLAEKISKVYRAFDDQPEDIKELIKHFNW
jgi:hypothetical protein